MVNRENFESTVDYTTVLSNFEGPLDLLLFLINKEEIEIKDVFVSQVTEQFLSYMRGLPYHDVDKVSAYLNIAATILKIKAQSLVPNLEEDPELAMEIEEDKAELIRALEEFRLIKEETKKLKEMETIGYFFKEPDKHVGETRTVFSLDNLTLDGLVNAFSKLLIKQEFAKAQDEVREIPRDEYTVEEKIQIVMESIESGGNVRFEQLFTKDHTKSEIVTTFQAILELLKYQYLRVKQNETFGEIVISLNPDRKEEPIGTIDQYHSGDLVRFGQGRRSNRYRRQTQCVVRGDQATPR